MLLYLLIYVFDTVSSWREFPGLHAFVLKCSMNDELCDNFIDVKLNQAQSSEHKVSEVEQIYQHY